MSRNPTPRPAASKPPAPTDQLFANLARKVDNAMLRFLILSGWAGLVIIVGGAAVTAGFAGSVLVGGVEVAAIVLGAVAAVLTPAWARSVAGSQQAARERAGRY